MGGNKHDEEYDIVKAFGRIEQEIIASMIRNLERHRAEEEDYGFNWSQWQVEQLAALEEYKRYNSKKYGTEFENLNKRIENLINIQYEAGVADQEVEILEAIKRRKRVNEISEALTAGFWHSDNEKMDALIKATTNDMEKAEAAILRMSNDKYRSVIFNAQIYMNSGAGTYEKAVDMATKDLLAAGLNCIEYKNGARHRLEDYVDMALKTANKRAKLYADGERRQRMGIYTVIVPKRGNPCPKCLPFVGKVFIDDVWSGGDPNDKRYPLISSAMAAGLFHPRCKDMLSTYRPGHSTADDTWTEEELANIEKYAKQEARQQYAERQVEKYDRLATYSLDEENKKQYSIKEKQWSAVANDVKSDIIKDIEIPEEALGIDCFSEEMYDAVKEEIDRISEEYTVMLDEIVVEGLGNRQKKVPFQFQARPLGYFPKMVLVINKEYNFPASIHEFNQIIMTSKVAGDNINDLIAHELAHVMTYQGMPYSQAANLEIPFIRGVSLYADSSFDGAESLAEAFVRFKNGDELADEAMELLKEYILKWRK